MMQTIWNEINQRIQAIDFESLWPSFHPYPFALYTEKEAYFAGETYPRPEGFIGCTTVQHEGQQIAIWNLDVANLEDHDRLTALLVHEMFHAHQISRNEMRFPNDLILLKAHHCVEALAYKILEREAITEDIHQFHALRLQRKNLESTEDEEYLETVEGMAQTMEYKALSQLNREKSEEYFQEKMLALKNPKNVYGRHNHYDVGMMILLQGEKEGLFLTHTIGEESRSIFELLDGQMKSDTLSVDLPIEAAEREYRKIQSKKEEAIGEFLNKETVTIPGPFTICGYDPMNLHYLNCQFFSSHFIALMNEQGEISSFMGPSLLKMNDDSAHQVVEILREKNA